MTVVSDPSANADEKIERAARVLRASKQNKEVFEAIYAGSRRFKTTEEIRDSVSHFNKHPYKAAARLYGEDIVDRKKVKGTVSYGKKDSYIHHRDRILSLSANARRLKTYPTKRKSVSHTVIKTYAFRSAPEAEMLAVDDIDSFKDVKKIKSADASSLKPCQNVRSTGPSAQLCTKAKRKIGAQRETTSTPTI